MGLVWCDCLENSINLVTLVVDTKSEDRSPCWMTEETELSSSLIEVVYLF
jgi:hypothetical protein